MRRGVGVGLWLWAAVAVAQTVNPVTQVGGANALSTVSQRHLVRVAPAGRPATLLLAVQRDAYSSPDPEGLHWYRSDDGGKSWRHYQKIFDDGISGRELHLAVDAITVGEDVAVVLSYDTTETNFSSDARDPERKVYFQWWRHDGAGEWTPGTRRTIASPPSGSAYHRATLARDSKGRLWVHAWLRGSCPSSAGVACSDTLRVFVSTDDGQSFAALPSLVKSPVIGGGRVLSLGTRLVAVWGDYSWDNPAQLAWRDDDEPLDTWHGPIDAFSDGDSIYHGAALQAVADGGGGMHLVYKDRHENLYYRHFDGTAFGARTFVDGPSSGSDWALQPAITLRGGELYVCTNHPTTANSKHQLRSYRLSDGFSSYEVLDSTSSFKAYPTAPEVLPLDAPTVPCAFSANTGPSELRVGLLAVEAAPPPPPPPPPPSSEGGAPKLETLTDPFVGPSADPAVWSVGLLSGGGAVSVGSGVMTLGPVPNDGSSGAYVTSAQRFTLNDSHVQLRAEQVVNAGANVSCRVRVHPPMPGGWNDDVGFWFEGGVLYAFRTRDGASSDVGHVSYLATRDAWWRIRSTGGQVIWETSPDGSAWTSIGTLPVSELSFDPGDVQLSFEARAFGSGASAPGSFQISSLNIGPSGAPPEESDGGAGVDAGSVADAGAELDGAGVFDGGAEVDGGTQIDAGTEVDAGTSADAGIPDAGTPVDGGGATPGTLPLTDSFAGPAVDISKWSVVLDSSGSAAFASNGQLHLALEPESGAAGVHVTSLDGFDLRGLEAHVKVASVNAPAANASTRLVITPAVDGWDAHAGFWFEKGTLYLFYESPSGGEDVKVLTYSAAQHAWWRLREAAGTLYWETSPDGATWTTQAARASSAVGFPLSSVHLRMEVKAWSPGSSNPGAAIFERLNE